MKNMFRIRISYGIVPFISISLLIIVSIIMLTIKDKSYRTYEYTILNNHEENVLSRFITVFFCIGTLLSCIIKIFLNLFYDLSSISNQFNIFFIFSEFFCIFMLTFFTNSVSKSINSISTLLFMLIAII